MDLPGTHQQYGGANQRDCLKIDAQVQFTLRQEHEQVVGVAVRGRTVVPGGRGRLLQVAHEHARFG
jgi:hypothetical protein